MYNKELIKEFISHHKYATFTEISESLGVSISEIYRVVEDQINEEVVKDNSRVELRSKDNGSKFS